MKSLLLGATVMMGLSFPSWAAHLNEIRIDATSAGSVKTLSITQDDANVDNQVSGTAGGGSALPVKVPGTGSPLIRQVAPTSSTARSRPPAVRPPRTWMRPYTGGGNTHSLDIGAVQAPTDPTVQISVHNSGGGSNTITDSLDGAALTYSLTVTGTDNAISNSVSATGAITLNQGGGGYGVTGSRNSVTNNVSGVAAFTHNLTIAGSDNTVLNTVSNGGNKTITENIGSSGNTVTMTLDAAGNQDAALTVNSGSMVNSPLSSGGGAAANIILSNVIGAASAPAVINVTQTVAAVGATANLGISGGPSPWGIRSRPGWRVCRPEQSRCGLNANVTANANGYTVNIAQ